MPGVLPLVLFQARRDRVTLPVWILGITLLSFATSTAVTTQFGDEAAQAAILTLAASNPAFRFLRGLPDGTGVGAVVFFQGYAFTAVLAGLMSTFQVVRRTRLDEELGRVGAYGLRRGPGGTVQAADGLPVVLIDRFCAGRKRGTALPTGSGVPDIHLFHEHLLWIIGTGLICL